MVQQYKNKTFLFYFNKDSLVWKIDPRIKILLYIAISCFVLLNHLYVVNVVLSLSILGLLISIGFFAYRKNLLKVFILSLTLFFLISFVLQIITNWKGMLSLLDVLNYASYIFQFFSKWILINTSGLFLFAILSQNELINVLKWLKINFKLLISITIAFNMIGRLLESLEEIDLALLSRGVQKRKDFSIFPRFIYIFTSMILDNIEYISSLRATYAFDYANLQEEYGK